MGKFWLKEAPHPLLTATGFIRFPPPAPTSLNLRMGENPTVSPRSLPPPHGTFPRTQERAELQAWNGLDYLVGMKGKWKTLRMSWIVGLRIRSGLQVNVSC